MTAAQKPIITSHRGRQVVLGRRHVSPPIVGPRRMLAHRLLESLPPPPPEVDWLKAALDQAPGGDLGMMGNDQLGDCTIAAAGHARQIWTANTGTMETPSDASVIADYSKVDGYVPGDPSTDQGGVEADVLAAWQRSGVAGSKLDAWVPVNFANIDHVRKAIYHFGLVYIGVALPNTTATQDGEWTLDLGAGADAEAGSRGGHAVIVPKYGRESLTCVTWGEPQDMSLDFAFTYIDECFAPLCTPLWCRGGRSPLGETAKSLLTALQAVV
jgi:hypothetical protein